MLFEEFNNLPIDEQDTLFKKWGLTQQCVRLSLHELQHRLRFIEWDRLQSMINAKKSEYYKERFPSIMEFFFSLFSYL